MTEKEPTKFRYGVACKSQEGTFMVWFATKDFEKATILTSCITNQNSLIRVPTP